MVSYLRQESMDRGPVADTGGILRCLKKTSKDVMSHDGIQYEPNMMERQMKNSH